MGEPVHVARITIKQRKRPNREAHIEGFAEPLRFGMHGGYAEFYKLPQGEKVPTTVDHLIAALGG
jgi:hypothetical protein